jgi:hypothetical protein
MIYLILVDFIHKVEQNGNRSIMLSRIKYY